MSSWQTYGGLGRTGTSAYVSSNSVVASSILTANNSGSLNTKTRFSSHIDLSGNSILNCESIYLCNGASLSTGATTGNVYFPGSSLTVDNGITSNAGTNWLNGPLNVTGTIRATQYLCPSDERIKCNIVNLDESVDLLRPVSYLNRLTGKYEMGFVAGEVQKIFPHLVEDGDDFQSVNYQGLIALLVKEIQDLKKKMA